MQKIGKHFSLLSFFAVTMTENREENPEFSLITPEKAREPLLIYIFLMKCFNYSALPLVGEIYSRKWSYKNWRVLNVIFMISWTTFLYAWNAYEFRHNPSKMFLSIMCLGFDVLGVQRFFKFIVGRNLMVLSACKVRDFTEKWEKRSEGYRILVWYFNLIKTLVLSGMAIFFSIGIFITLAPLLIFLVTGRLQLVYPLYVPSVDSTTHPGFEFHVFLGTFMLFTIDTVGTIIDLKFEKLLNEVWNVPWYLMDMKNKKSFCYFLANAQKTDRLSVGGRVPLSLNTFVQLYKGIYSYLMILLEMQN